MDDEHRINADLMAQRPFDYPYSMPGLLVCKAAEAQGGQEAHWDMFDRIQRAHLTECLNIADLEVLRQCATDVCLDVVRWEKDYRSAKVRAAVEGDLARARLFGITGVPTLVAEGRFVLVGAQAYERLVAWKAGALPPPSAPVRPVPQLLATEAARRGPPSRWVMCRAAGVPVSWHAEHWRGGGAVASWGVGHVWARGSAHPGPGSREGEGAGRRTGRQDTVPCPLTEWEPLCPGAWRIVSV
jgi:hypothetical protein